MDDVVVPPDDALPPDFCNDGEAVVALLDNSDGPHGGEDAAADQLAGGWVPGARVIVFVAGATACRILLEYAESPALRVLRAFAPGSRELALVLAGAAALVAIVARPGGVVQGEALDAAVAHLGVPAQGQHRLRCPAWVRRGARAILFHANSRASQAVQVISGFAAGTSEMVLVLAAAGALVANLARPHGIHGDGAHLAAQEQQQQRRGRRCAAWLRRALLVLYIATAAAASYNFLATFASTPRN